MEQRQARLATRSKGIVTWDEMIDAGISRKQIEGRARKGVLIREYKGVYRVGHSAPNVESSFMAAVKACGEGALLSDLAAAFLYWLIKGDPPPPEVTAPKDRDIEGVITHWARAGIDPRDRTIYHGIPVTTVPRTLVDIAARLDDDRLMRAVHEAVVRFSLTPAKVEVVLARRPRSPGAGRLRAIVSGDSGVLLGKLEKGFKALLVQHGIPLPQTNRKAGAHWVDCRWPGRLTVELDSFAFHNTRWSWEQSYQRRRAAKARGEEFRRYTWTDVFDDPAPMIEEVRALASAHPEGWQSG